MARERKSLRSLLFVSFLCVEIHEKRLTEMNVKHFIVLTATFIPFTGAVRVAHGISLTLNRIAKC